MKAIHMGRERRQRLVSMVRYVAGLGLALGLLSPYAASAQSYPSKPIKMISPYTAGGLSDTVARGFAEKLSEVLGVADGGYKIRHGERARRIHDLLRYHLTRDQPCPPRQRGL
jgi:hypothetical protein